MNDIDEDLLRDLPVEIWLESDVGQSLLALAREGKCKYTRMNATLGRFDRIESDQEVRQWSGDASKIYRPTADAPTVGGFRADYSAVSPQDLKDDPQLAELYSNSSPPELASVLLMPRELTDAQADAALRATAVWLDVKGSQLTVNREKMKARYRALVKFIELQK